MTAATCDKKRHTPPEPFQACLGATCHTTEILIGVSKGMLPPLSAGPYSVLCLSSRALCKAVYAQMAMVCRGIKGSHTEQDDVIGLLLHDTCLHNGQGISRQLSLFHQYVVVSFLQRLIPLQTLVTVGRCFTSLAQKALLQRPSLSDKQKIPRF